MEIQGGATRRERLKGLFIQPLNHFLNFYTKKVKIFINKLLKSPLKQLGPNE